MLETTTLAGALVVGAGGIIMGSAVWPFKLMRKYQFEHWWFVSCVAGLIVMPWAITLLGCPQPFTALRSVPVEAVLLGNLFALGWGIANVMCGLCFVRIGVALTGAILTGLGASAGAILPLILKGSGRFKDAADVTSPAGRLVLVGVAVLLAGVILASLAGFGRDQALKKLERTSGGFLGGLIMAAVAGLLSSCIAFSFVYSQGPIIAHFSEVEPNTEIKVTIADQTRKCAVSADGTAEIEGVGPVQVAGVSAADAAGRIKGRLPERSDPAPDSKAPEVVVETGSIPATFAVWAVGLAAGAVVNIAYAAHRLTRNKSWGVLAQSWRELALAVVIGINFSVAVTLMGKGMLLLGALGASIGFGIQQAMQMIGGQGLGFISGEWRGVHGTPRVQMYLAIAILLVAAVVLAYSNTLAKA